MYAIIGILGEIFNLHTGCGDVVRLHAQNTLDDAIAFLAGLLACARDEFVCGECIYLTRQIRVLAQTSAELRYNLGHALHADLSTLRFYHSVQFKLHPFLVCHAVSLPLLVVPAFIIPCFYRKSYKKELPPRVSQTTVISLFFFLLLFLLILLCGLFMGILGRRCEFFLFCRKCCAICIAQYAA